MSDTKHTPTPWVVRITKNGGDWTYEIRTRKPHNPAGTIGKHIATVNKFLDANANAEFIVRACNAYADLLAACERADIYFDANMGTETSVAFQRLRHEVTRAIAKAKEVDVDDS